MLKRPSKTEPKTEHESPARILVVDDNPDSARLVGKLFRRAGYEVAEIGDQSVAMLTLNNETTPVSAVVGSFSIAGNTATLKLVDAIRHSNDQRVKAVRVALMLDGPRQELLAWQSGVDALVVRPYRSEEMLESVAQMLERPEAKRESHRRDMIEAVRDGNTGTDDSSESDGSPTAAMFN